MKTKKLRIAIIALVFIAGVAVFFGMRSFVFSEIHARIDDKIKSLNASGFNVRYDSLLVDWRKNVITIDKLVLEKDAYDTACIYPEYISIGKVRAEGFSLFPLIFRRTLSFDDFHLDELRIVMRENSRLTPEPSPERKKDFTINIGRGTIRGVDFTYTDSAKCSLVTGIKTNLTIDELTLAFEANSALNWQLEDLSFDSTEIDFPQALYRLNIKQARMDFPEERFRADSIRLTPLESKMAFSRKYGYEIDRFEAVIPFFEAQHLTYSKKDSTIKSTFTEIQFYLKVFRDKRLPFVKKAKLLPIDQLRTLPFALLIDSLKIRKSYVEYEEFAEEATEPGKVYFDNLYASIYHIDNRSVAGNTTLRAKANLLGQGNIDLFVAFPHAAGKASQISGTLVAFNMPEINSMLTPSTNIKVESGEMDKLSFNFSFDDVRSDGELGLNYRDLKLTIFKEEEKKGDVPDKDNLKTFIMNTFIFKTNMDEKMPEEKRTGTVGFMRDQNRSIFNFWVKSLVSGIKSAYNLENMGAKKTEREAKKEQRLTKREKRRLKRAEKKKERG